MFLLAIAARKPAAIGANSPCASVKSKAGAPARRLQTALAIGGGYSSALLNRAIPLA